MGKAAPETFLQRAVLADVLEPSIAAAQRGQYELLLAEIERAVGRLSPGATPRVLMRVGGRWHEWSALDGQPDDQPCPDAPADMQTWGAPRRIGGAVYLPIAVGAVGVWIEAAADGLEASDDLAVLRQCFSLALQTCERQRIAARNLDEVQALQRVATRILKSHDLEEILLHITQEAKRLLSADICGVLLREGDRIVMRRCIGNHSPETAGLRMGPGQGLAGRVLERREPSSVEDYLASDIISRDFFELAEAELVRSALAVPLLGRESVIGVLEVWRRRPSTFTAHDSIRLVALANLASIAIENAELYATQGRIVEQLGRANDSLNQRYDTVRSLSNLTQNVMQALLQGGGLPAIVACASGFLDADVAIVDREGRQLAWSGTSSATDVLPRLVHKLPSLESMRAQEMAEPQAVEGEDAVWKAGALLVEGDAIGWVLVRVGPRGSDVTELTVTQLAMMAALQRLEQRAASRARAETIDAIIWDLLHADDAVRNAAVDRAADIKLDLTGPLRLFMCEIGATAADRAVLAPRRQLFEAIGELGLAGLRALAVHGQTMAVLCCDLELDDAERLAQRLANRLADTMGGRLVLVGGSSRCGHARSLAAAFGEATIALDVARQFKRTGAAVYDRAGVVGMLLGLRHEAGLRHSR